MNALPDHDGQGRGSIEDAPELSIGHEARKSPDKTPRMFRDRHTCSTADGEAEPRAKKDVRLVPACSLQLVRRSQACLLEGGHVGSR